MQSIIVGLSDIYCEIRSVPIFLLNGDKTVVTTGVFMLYISKFHSSARHYSPAPFLCVLRVNNLQTLPVICFL